MKKCSKCGIERRLEYFSQSKGPLSGKKPKCKFCYAEYDKKRREQKKKDSIYSF
jgi:hypothetical protein